MEEFLYQVSLSNSPSPIECEKLRLIAFRTIFCESVNFPSAHSSFFLSGKNFGSKKTSFLLAGEAAGSKLAKAESLGIPVLSLEDLMKRLNK